MLRMEKTNVLLIRYFLPVVMYGILWQIIAAKYSSFDLFLFRKNKMICIKYLQYIVFYNSVEDPVELLIVVLLCWCLTFQALEASGLLIHVMSLKHHWKYFPPMQATKVLVIHDIKAGVESAELFCSLQLIQVTFLRPSFIVLGQARALATAMS